MLTAFAEVAVGGRINYFHHEAATTEAAAAIEGKLILEGHLDRMLIEVGTQVAIVVLRDFVVHLNVSFLVYQRNASLRGNMLTFDNPFSTLLSMQTTVQC